ncbi:WXG100 family type VII secretion target [Nocardia amikacinitolerans]|uniref:WXG100 family type VII secretion target n=1 Tax=Nocardia amikacinitolerans TaxID=756689 RepID=UPI0020A3F945|nr:WXG100 family type VII secretion target [Nocardia amikacinitolerans]MCP2289128.1 WXG100 family type VII secretion target [Nocardia amikacinitolerans]
MTTGDGSAFSVVTDDVKALGRYAYKLAEELRSGALSLDREVTALLSTWKGSAADSYDTAWDEMHQGALTVWEELFELAAKLGITADTYRERDTSNASAIGSLDLP